MPLKMYNQPYIRHGHYLICMNIIESILHREQRNYLKSRMNGRQLSEHGYAKDLRYQMCPEKMCDCLVYMEV